MEFKGRVVFSVFLLCLVQISSLPTPKDSTLVKSDELIINNEQAINNVQKAQDMPPTKASNLNELAISGRVRCAYEGEEPTEDEDCQRHCIPKGYSYGLCIKTVCSCA